MWCFVDDVANDQLLEQPTGVAETPDTYLEPVPRVADGLNEPRPTEAGALQRVGEDIEAQSAEAIELKELRTFGMIKANQHLIPISLLPPALAEEVIFAVASVRPSVQT